MARIHGEQLTHGKLVQEETGANQAIIARSSGITETHVRWAHRLIGMNPLDENTTNRILLPYPSASIWHGAYFLGTVDQSGRRYVTSQHVFVPDEVMTALEDTPAAILALRDGLPAPTADLTYTNLPPYAKEVALGRVTNHSERDTLIRDIVAQHFGSPDHFFGLLNHLLAPAPVPVALFHSSGIGDAVGRLFLAVSVCLPKWVRVRLGFITGNRQNWALPSGLEPDVRLLRFVIGGDKSLGDSARFNLERKQWLTSAPDAHRWVERLAGAYQDAPIFGKLLDKLLKIPAIVPPKKLLQHIDQLESLKFPASSMPTKAQELDDTQEVEQVEVDPLDDGIREAVKKYSPAELLRKLEERGEKVDRTMIRRVVRLGLRHRFSTYASLTTDSDPMVAYIQSCRPATDAEVAGVCSEIDKDIWEVIKKTESHAYLDRLIEVAFLCYVAANQPDDEQVTQDSDEQVKQDSDKQVKQDSPEDSAIYYLNSKRMSSPRLQGQWQRFQDKRRAEQRPKAATSHPTTP